MEHNHEGEARRAPSRASAERAVEHKDAMLDRLSAEYRELQMKIMGLEQDLSKGIEHTIQNPRMKELATEVGRGITQELEALRGKKTEVEEAITNVGGNPSEYTVQ